MEYGRYILSSRTILDWLVSDRVVEYHRWDKLPGRTCIKVIYFVTKTVSKFLSPVKYVIRRILSDIAIWSKSLNRMISKIIELIIPRWDQSKSFLRIKFFHRKFLLKLFYFKKKHFANWIKMLFTISVANFNYPISPFSQDPRERSTYFTTLNNQLRSLLC